MHSFGWVLKTKKLSGKSDNKCVQDFKTEQNLFYGNNPLESQMFKNRRLKGNVQPDSS